MSKISDAQGLIDYLWQEFCELPDRSSPDEYPDMALVSLSELTGIVENFTEIRSGGEEKDGVDHIAGAGKMVLVPVAPTDEMLQAFEDEYVCIFGAALGSPWSKAEKLYAAMIAAAPALTNTDLSLLAENERLREVVSKCADSLGNGAFISPAASIEFMEKLPGEIASVSASTKAKLVEATKRVWTAVLSCPHTITHNEIILRYSATTPGNNAADQLNQRIAAALQGETK